MDKVKEEIIFNTSMTADKRNKNFAYLRKGIADVYGNGMYPAKDFVISQPTTALLDSDSIVDIIGGKIIVKQADNDLRFYRIGENTPSNNNLVLGAANLACAYAQNEADALYIVENDAGKVWNVRVASANVTEVATFPSIPSVTIGGYDGLKFWWVGEEIWSQLPGQVPTLIFSSTGFGTAPSQIDFYEDQMIIWVQENNDIVVYFWDKSDTTFFQKRITIKNSTFMGGVVINGQLMMVYYSPDASNIKEKTGNIVVTALDGYKFRQINSIIAGSKLAQMHFGNARGTACRCNNEYMILATRGTVNTKNTDLFKEYVYKIYRDGRIEVLTEVVTNGTRTHASVVNFINEDGHIIGLNAGGTGFPPKLYVDKSDTNAWNNYVAYNNSTYITNFLGSPYNDHRLEAIEVAFEKLLRNGGTSATTDEELDIYYRTSDRDAWVLLGNVTAQKVIDNVNLRGTDSTTPLKEQRYQITKMPDNSALPEFNEIQFKFNSKKGFSIIGAWFEYEYITRNKVK